MFHVRKRTLLLIAGVVWFAAGFNILLLGIQAFGAVTAGADVAVIVALVAGAVAILFLFHSLIFSKMVRKHTARIMEAAEPRAAFWTFFDAKGYIMMAIMMGGGIGLRMSGLVPEWFIAFFYTGLGVALASAGVCFLVRFHRPKNAPAPCPYLWLRDSSHAR